MEVRGIIAVLSTPSYYCVQFPLVHLSMGNYHTFVTTVSQSVSQSVMQSVQCSYLCFLLLINTIHLSQLLQQLSIGPQECTYIFLSKKKKEKKIYSLSVSQSVQFSSRKDTVEPRYSKPLNCSHLSIATK